MGVGNSISNGACCKEHQEEGETQFRERNLAMTLAAAGRSSETYVGKHSSESHTVPTESRKLEHAHAKRGSLNLPTSSLGPPVPSTSLYSYSSNGSMAIHPNDVHKIPKQQGRHELQSLEGWCQTQLRLPSACFWPDPALTSAKKNSWQWVYMRMDGWSLQMWEQPPKGSGNGFTPMFATHGVSNDRPLAWLDMRVVHDVHYVAGSPGNHSIICSSKNGSVELCFKQKDEAMKWKKWLHNIAFERKIQGSTAAIEPHEKLFRDLDAQSLIHARLEKLRTVWWRCVCRIALGQGLTRSDTVAVVELYREFDVNGDNNLSVNELATIIREQLLMRRHFLAECMEKHEKRLNSLGSSFYGENGISQKLHPDDQRICQVATDLLRSFDVQLEHHNLQKLTDKFHEQLDLAHGGKVTLSDFKHISPSVLFGEENLRREAVVYNVVNSKHNRPWDKYENDDDLEREGMPRESCTGGIDNFFDSCTPEVDAGQKRV